MEVARSIDLTGTLQALDRFRKSQSTSGGLRRSIKQKRVPRGFLLERHQDNERPLRAYPSRHLLRRTATREGAPKDGRKGKRSGPQAGISGASRRDQEPGHPPGASVQDARRRNQGS